MRWTLSRKRNTETGTSVSKEPEPGRTGTPPFVAARQVVIDIEAAGSGLHRALMRVMCPGETAAQVFAWRDDEFTADDGVHILCHGFDIGDHRDHYGIPGCLVFQLAGGTFHAAELRKRCFAAGNRVVLIPEPSNPYDRNAVAIWDLDRTVAVGHVPREFSAVLAAGLRGKAAEGLIVLEWKRGTQRVGLTILTGRPTDSDVGAKE